MPIYSVQMPNNKPRSKGVKPGFTMAELLAVVLLLSFFVLLAEKNLHGLLTKSTFKAQAHELVSTMQLAASAAAESNRRYEVFIDISEQMYLLRKITTPNLLEILDEEIIEEKYFGDKCRVVYVLFDDLIETNEDFQIASFRAGRTGWQNGGKIVLMDTKENEYSIVVNRLNRIVKLVEGDAELLMPKTKDEMSF